MRGNRATRAAHARSRAGFQHMQVRAFSFFKHYEFTSQYWTKNSAISTTEDNLGVEV